MRLKDKIALVTGAGSGIGRETALLFAHEGASVVAADISEKVYETATTVITNGGECIPVQSDASKPEECREMVGIAESSFGGLQAIVHAAATSTRGSVTTLAREEWVRVIDADLSSAFYLAQASVPLLERDGAGSIVFVASQLGLVGTRNSVAYTAAKGGLINLARSMALDHADQGVRVNCLCPGPVTTPFLQRSFERQSNPSEASQELLSRVPLGRFGTAQEIAHGALFLSSPEASYMTGAVLVMDGGFLAQ